jgi:hypothetical protein
MNQLKIKTFLRDMDLYDIDAMPLDFSEITAIFIGDLSELSKEVDNELQTERNKLLSKPIGVQPLHQTDEEKAHDAKQSLGHAAVAVLVSRGRTYLKSLKQLKIQFGYSVVAIARSVGKSVMYLSLQLADKSLKRCCLENLVEFKSFNRHWNDKISINQLKSDLESVRSALLFEKGDEVQAWYDNAMRLVDRLNESNITPTKATNMIDAFTKSFESDKMLDFANFKRRQKSHIEYQYKLLKDVLHAIVGDNRTWNASVTPQTIVETAITKSSKTKTSPENNISNTTTSYVKPVTHHLNTKQHNNRLQDDSSHISSDASGVAYFTSNKKRKSEHIATESCRRSNRTPFARSVPVIRSDASQHTAVDKQRTAVIRTGSEYSPSSFSTVNSVNANRIQKKPKLMECDEENQFVRTIGDESQGGDVVRDSETVTDSLQLSRSASFSSRSYVQSEIQLDVQNLAEVTLQGKCDAL